MIPKEFKNETDYRNIPREYLNPNIPKGRGMVKWQPFATLARTIRNHTAIFD